MLYALARELGELTARRRRQAGLVEEGDAALGSSASDSPLFARALQQLLAEGVEGCTKDLSRSSTSAAAGNSSYGAGAFQTAAQHYSDGLRWLPCGEHPAHAARLHGNRAQALLKWAAAASGSFQQQQQLATAAAEDCAAALAYIAAADRAPGGTTSCKGAQPAVDTAALRRKVLDRQSAAHTLLQQQQQQQHAAGTAVQRPAGSSTEQPEQQAPPQQQRVDAQKASGLSALVWRAQQAADAHLQQQQQQHPGCVRPTSVALRCCSDPGPRGRHLVAASRIPPGTLLISELPLAAVPLQQPGSSSSSGRQRPMLCSWCFGTVPPYCLWPCEACPLVAFCSSACRQAGGSSSTDRPSSPAAAAGAVCQHAPGGLECGKPWTQLLPAEALLASRCLAAAAAAGAGHGEDAAPSAAALLASLVAHPPPQQQGSSSQRRLPQDAAAADEEQQQVLAQAALAELVAAIHADHHDRQQHQGRHAGSAAPPAPAAVQRCLRQLAVNAIAVRPLLAAGAADRSGLGLYPLTAALVNHSCSPNCSIRFAGRQLLLTCVAGAAAGEELTISYGPQVGQHSTPERQALLQQQYRFACGCSACRQGLQQQEQQPDGPASLGILEAGLHGLACCSNGGSSGAGGQAGAHACPGAVPLHLPVPAGIVSVTAPPTTPGSLSASTSAPATCVTCGWRMPAEQLRTALQELEAAAALADEACHCASVGRAAQLLHAVVATRQRHLARSNLLLGRSHHQAAAAAVDAAAEAAGGSPAVLAVLQASLAMGSEQQVVLVLQQLRGMLDGAPAAAAPDSSLAQLPDLLEAALAAFGGGAIGDSDGPAGAQQQVQRMSLSGAVAADSVQEHVSRAAGHLCSSARMLSLAQPPDSLQLAAEVTACCAALMACSADVGQPGDDGCQLAGLAAALHKRASAVFQLHMPDVRVPRL